MAGGGDEEWTGLAHGRAGAIVRIAIVSIAIVRIAMLGGRSTADARYGYDSAGHDSAAMTLLAMLAMPTVLPVAYCLRHIGDQEQHAMVARALISVQQEVLEQHGYKGEQGFAQVRVGVGVVVGVGVGVGVGVRVGVGVGVGVRVRVRVGVGVSTATRGSRASRRPVRRT